MFAVNKRAEIANKMIPKTYGLRKYLLSQHTLNAVGQFQDDEHPYHIEYQGQYNVNWRIFRPQ